MKRDELVYLSHHIVHSLEIYQLEYKMGVNLIDSHVPRMIEKLQLGIHMSKMWQLKPYIFVYDRKIPLGYLAGHS